MWATFLLTHMQNKSYYEKEMLGTKLSKGCAVSDLWQTALVAHTGKAGHSPLLRQRNDAQQDKVSIKATLPISHILQT